jgi:outer membrane protein assembly factor BamA
MLFPYEKSQSYGFENLISLSFLCGMRLIFLTLFSIQAFCGLAQPMPNAAIVRDFLFEGNKRTKANVLTRELTFKVGDTLVLADLAAKLEENRLRLLNTNLFNTIQVNVKNWGNDDKVSVVITVTERWYFFPTPIFELADRNLNVWWKEQNHDLRRSNYGIRLTHKNTTGRRDPFSTTVKFGYTPQFSIGYGIPYLNKKQTIRGFSGLFYATNREIGYDTDSNRVVFFKNPTQNISSRFSYNAGLSFAPGLYHSQSLSMGYSQQKLDTAITERLNRDFFLNSAQSQAYFWLSYDFTFDNRNYKPFPTDGYSFGLNINKSGLFKNDDVNILNVSFGLSKYFKLHSKWVLETELRGKTTLIRQQQPYNLRTGLGYGGNNVRGYELFVVDGYDFGVLKNSLRYLLIDKDIDISFVTNKSKYLKNLSSFPLKIFLSFSLDLGYSYTPQYKPSNTFNNRLLSGGGVGLNILALNGMLWQVEYSLNHTGQGGFYVRSRSNF